MPDPVPVSPSRRVADESIGELPPLDGESDDDVPDAEIHLDLDADHAGDPFDDATGEAEPVDLDLVDLAASEGESSEGAEPDERLDAASEDALALGSDGWLEPGAADTLEAPDEDPDLEEGESVAADAGDEGPLDGDEAVREEDLPSLDADDGGEVDDRRFFDSEGLAEGELPLPWSKSRWDPTPVARHSETGPVVAIAPGPLGALCLGDRLFRVELDGAAVPLAAAGLPERAGRGMTRTGSTVFVRTDGGLYRSDDGGLSFAATDEAVMSEGRPSLAAAEAALPLPRGFEIAAAASLGGALYAVVRGVTFGRLHVVAVPLSRGGDGLGGLAAGQPEIVAELAEPEARGGDEAYGDARDRLAAAWDEERRLLWIGGAFGVLALQPSGGAR